ncbi:thiamine-monophosphate kinase [Agaricicola taiwanensis]|uniref:Thiamine-monophosphate kinase n=1 Tax=Agaricicola taiwanensis TaxID=591372 RepID=A0A8J2YIS0_9RHOB|nr:thiamine-phosphate kinase [Agaricicola taiwanensis]GGE46338.1 thiamine-monophosphate kinase [Agaricicola taiwanensis]
MAEAGERPDEDELIARFLRPLATSEGAAELRDDAAGYAPPPGHELVLTTDAIVAGVHFFPDDPADAIARRALRVNLSDLAAKGAEPAGYLLTLALPPDWTVNWLEAFTNGLRADQQAFGLSLYGGDTVRTHGPVWVSVTAFGLVPDGRRPLRAGARVGDCIYLSGSVGDAALGLLLRQNPDLFKSWGISIDERDHLLDRYLKPQPRVRLASTIAKFASASMDVSDGLLGDLERLCEASDVAAAVEIDNLPLSPAARKALRADFDAQAAVLGGGDDYEILATLPPEHVKDFEESARRARIPVTRIGEIVGGAAGRLRVTSGGRVLNVPARKYQHF